MNKHLSRRMLAATVIAIGLTGAACGGGDGGSPASGGSASGANDELTEAARDQLPDAIKDAADSAATGGGGAAADVPAACDLLTDAQVGEATSLTVSSHKGFSQGVLDLCEWYTDNDDTAAEIAVYNPAQDFYKNVKAATTDGVEVSGIGRQALWTAASSELYIDVSDQLGISITVDQAVVGSGAQAAAETLGKTVVGKL